MKRKEKFNMLTQGKEKPTTGAGNNSKKNNRGNNGAKINNFNVLSENNTGKAGVLLIAPIVTANGRAAKRSPYRKPQAVKVLEELANMENQRQHPNMKAAYLGKYKYRDDTANGLTKCIVDFIRLKGYQAERINTTGIPIDTSRQVTDILGHARTIGGVHWRSGGGTNGSADISATIKGQSVKVEVKIGKDRQSEAQKEYQKQVEQAGGLYFIAKDFTAFVEWYNETFVGEGGAR